MTDKEKRALGKYYTVNNPFNLAPFRDWFNSIPGVLDLIILEPFAGSNNIPKLMNVGNDWACFDIAPTDNVYPRYKIETRDTIADFPTGYSIAITNPPYGGKPQCRKNKIQYYGDPYGDMYKKCLEVSLSCVDYLAAIIPESFFTATEFRDRLAAIISLPCPMFDDTKCPVCLALFNKDNTEDFAMFSMDNFIGWYKKDLFWYKPIDHGAFNWNFYDPDGEIGLKGTDSVGTGPTDLIQFIEGTELHKIVSDLNIKKSSRNDTRISLYTTVVRKNKKTGKEEKVRKVVHIKNLPFFIQKCNEYLNWFRSNTQDVFLTSFMGLRNNGTYRRRLDYDTAKGIMEYVLLTFKKDLL